MNLFLQMTEQFLIHVDLWANEGAKSRWEESGRVWACSSLLIPPQGATGTVNVKMLNVPKGSCVEGVVTKMRCYWELVKPLRDTAMWEEVRSLGKSS